MNAIGPFGQRYLTPFIENLSEPLRSSYSLARVHEIWEVDVDEFPWTQCVEESYTRLAPAFQDEYDAVQIWTEYGHPVSYFNIADYLALCTDLVGSGLTVQPLHGAVPKLHDYGRP
ncbi:hypothetical protein [Ramlibacter sp.]|uniref:hypothetical protein n=1 Tax=Ramlibacter sp. TaxID=1917967 RepID=UPI002D78C747|nr:hypothetical protein [Ramlibacter sp.]